MQVAIEVFAEPEYLNPRGNVLCSGDDAADREAEDEIIARLNAGDDWAWCNVRVRVSVGTAYAEDYLGACSFANEAEFRASSGYFDEMVSACKAQLVADARDVIAALGA